MSGTGDVGPANGGPDEGSPAEGGLGKGRSADGSPADGSQDEASAAGGGAHGGGPADGTTDDGSGSEAAEAAAPAASGEGGSGRGTSAGATAVPGGSADPGELLGEMRAIRRRARLARHAYWFPLVLFGLLTSASVPFYLGQPAFGPGGFATRLSRRLPPQSGFFAGDRILTAGIAYYWLGAMLLGITATVIWYRWRGNRIGLRTPARGYLITGLVLLALALLIPVVSGRNLGLPLIWPGSYVIRGTFPLVLIGLGLCVLAWSERSTGLGAIAAGYLAVSFVVNLYILNNVLHRLHWNLNPAAAAVPNVALPALVLLLAGAGAWAVQRRYRPPAEPEAAEG